MFGGDFDGQRNAVFHAVGSEGRRFSIRVVWHGSLSLSLADLSRDFLSSLPVEDMSWS